MSCESRLAKLFAQHNFFAVVGTAKLALEAGSVLGWRSYYYLGVSYDQVSLKFEDLGKRARCQKQALLALAKALSMAPRSSDVSRALAITYLHQGSYRWAMRFARRAFLINYLKPQNLILLGNLYRSQGMAILPMMLYSLALLAPPTRQLARKNLEFIRADI